MRAAWITFPVEVLQSFDGHFKRPRFFVYLGDLKEKSRKILLCLISRPMRDMWLFGLNSSLNLLINEVYIVYLT